MRMRAGFSGAMPGLLLISLLSLSSGSVHAEDAKVDLGWAWTDVELDEGIDGDIEIRVRDATLQPGELGEPDLPAFLVRVRAPERSRPSSYRIAGMRTSSRTIDGSIRRVTTWTPDGIQLGADPPDAAGESPFPAERVCYMGLHCRRGTAWAAFAVYPLVIEDGKRFSLLEDGVLEVVWGFDPNTPIPLRSLRGPHGEREEGKRTPLPGGVYREEISERPSIDSDPVDFLILTIEAFEEAIRPLADWKNRSGTPAAIRTVEWVLANYPAGVDRPDRIRKFLIEAYRYWGTKWLLIVGGPDEVPIRTVRSFAYTPDGQDGLDVMTDLYYGCLDGNWNADGDEIFGEASPPLSPPGQGGDEVDFDAELYVGRIPATTREEVSIWLQKYFVYALSPVTDGYLDRMLLLGEVLQAVDWTRSVWPPCGDYPRNCPEYCDRCVVYDGANFCVRAIYMIDHAPDVALEYVELYEWFEFWQENGRPDAQLEIESTVIEQLNSGAGFAYHSGHAVPDRWSVGTKTGADGNGRVTRSDALALTNGDRLGVGYTIGCEAAAFEDDGLAEGFLFAPDGGMITYIGSTEISYTAAARYFQDLHFGKLFEEKQSIGESFFGTIADAMAGAPDNESSRRLLAFSIALLGDPQPNLWFGTPAPIACEASSAFTLGDSVCTVQASSSDGSLEGATVCISKVDEHEVVHAVAATGADGRASVPFRPTREGRFAITITHPRAIPYQEEAGRVVVVPADEGDLSIRELEVVDSEAGRSGSANGRFDEGETVALDVIVRNGGTSPAGGNLTLLVGPESLKAYVEILDDQEQVESIGPGEETRLERAFRIRLASQIPEELHQNGDRVPFVAAVRVESGESVEFFERALPCYRPVLAIDRCSVAERSGGDGDGVPDAGETIEWKPALMNLGCGSAANLVGHLEAVDGISVLVGSAMLEADERNQRVEALSPFLFFVDTEDPRASILVRSALDSSFVFFDRVIEFDPPEAPGWRDGEPTVTQDAIRFVWERSTSADVEGYLIEWSADPVNDLFQRLNHQLVCGMCVYEDETPGPLTTRSYRLSAVDSSGNGSGYSEILEATTHPGSADGWPFTGQAYIEWGCPTIENLDGSGPYEIMGAGEQICGLRSSGEEIIDGDGDGATQGVWASDGGGFWSKPAIADLDGDGSVEVAGTSRYASPSSGIAHVHVWERTGQLRWSRPLWDSDYPPSSPVIADIDQDPEGEVIVHHRGILYAFNHDGTPAVDGNDDGILAFVAGDAPTGLPYAHGSPAAADIDGDGKDEVILGLAKNTEDSWSSLVLVDGDGAVLAERNLEQDVSGTARANSSPSLADVDGDDLYEIFLTTRNYLWSFYYDTSTGTIEPEPDFQPPLGGVGIPSLPGNWIEPTPAIGDINGDGVLDVVVSTGGGGILAVDGRYGTELTGFPYNVTSGDKKLGSPILVQMDNDVPAEIVVGDNGGVLHAIDFAAGGQEIGPVPGFPYTVDGSLLQGLNYWDVDRNRHPNLIIQPDRDHHIYNLDIHNVDFPETWTLGDVMEHSPWTSFRHDARNTGTIDKDKITPVTLIDVVAMETAGAVVLEWDLEVEPSIFRILRRDDDGAWRTRTESPAASLRGETGYRYCDEAEPGSYSYRVIGFDPAGREVCRSRDAAVTLRVFRLRFTGVVPNPFSARTAINVETPGGPIGITVLELGGRRVRELVRGPIPAGAHRFYWDGLDDEGHAVGSGVYVARLSGLHEDRSTKVVLLR